MERNSYLNILQGIWLTEQISLCSRGILAHLQIQQKMNGMKITIVLVQINHKNLAAIDFIINLRINM